MRWRGLLWFAPVLAAGLGMIFVAAAAMTPWHTDSDAYFAGLNAIRDGLYDGGGYDFARASAAFHDLQDRYATPKWLFADIGYSLLAWAALLMMVVWAAIIRGEGALTRSTRRFWPVAGFTLLALALLLLSLVADALHGMGREQVPEWGDSVGVVYMAATAAVMFFVPLILLLALSPLLPVTRAGASIFRLPRLRGRDIAVTVLYAGPCLVAVLFLFGFGQPGGWAVSPLGAILLWLFLNARALWIGPDEPPPAP